MKKSGFAEERIAYGLRQAQADSPGRPLVPAGVSKTTRCIW
jgi:hypothetical protein